MDVTSKSPRLRLPMQERSSVGAIGWEAQTCGSSCVYYFCPFCCRIFLSSSSSFSHFVSLVISLLLWLWKFAPCRPSRWTRSSYLCNVNGWKHTSFSFFDFQRVCSKFAVCMMVGNLRLFSLIITELLHLPIQVLLAPDWTPNTPKQTSSSPSLIGGWKRAR